MLWRFAVAVANAQAYEPSPCVADPTLAAQLAAGRVARIVDQGPTSRMSLASSLLAPPSTPLRSPAQVDARYPHVEAANPGSQAALRADDHACTYAAMNLTDGDPSTAWCEGTTGEGIGEAALVEWTGKPGGIEVRNGYARSADTFANNGRARRIEVIVLGPGTALPVQGDVVEAVAVIARHEVDLADRNEGQPVALPPLPTGASPGFVAIRILSVWPGTKWQDTCISELRAVP